MSVKRIVFLNNGRPCPMIGLGTWRTPIAVTRQAVCDAIDVGFRHIDCAHSYLNQQQVGEAIQEKIRQGVIERDDVFITGKLWNTQHRPEMVRCACEKALRELEISCFDLYLIHYPMGYKEGEEMHPKDENDKIIFSDIDYVDTWRAMEELIDYGLCRAIGLSNFNKNQIERILSYAKKPISMLQVECHPYLNQQSLMEFCACKGIRMTAYSPLGSPHTPYEKPGEYPILKHPVILKIATSHQSSPAEILIAYQVQRLNVVITRSVNKEHMKSNLNAYEVILTKGEIEEIDTLDCNGRFMTMEVASGHPYHPFEENEKKLSPTNNAADVRKTLTAE